MYMIAKDKGDGPGYLDIYIGDTFNNGRYVVQKYLDYHALFTLWLAWDTINSEYVALKVIIRKKVYSEKAKEEISILEQVRNGDQNNERRVVKLLDHFIHSTPLGDHVCMVLEYFGDDLVTLNKCLAPKGLPLHIVKKLCLDILDGLDYLHTKLSLIHGDVQPSNIYLMSNFDPVDDPHRSVVPLILPPQKSTILEHDINSLVGSVEFDRNRPPYTFKNYSPEMRQELLDSLDHRCKLVNFDRACFTKDWYYHSIQIPYRSPEVILGSGFSTSADLWSFACLCFEIATGSYLFFPQARDNYSQDEDHLALMIELLGKMPVSIALGGPVSEEYFNDNGDLWRVTELSPMSIKDLLVEDYNFPKQEADEFGEFLESILKFDKKERPTAAECRTHPWFDDIKVKDDDVSDSKYKGSNKRSNICISPLPRNTKSAFRDNSTNLQGWHGDFRLEKEGANCTKLQ